MTRSNQDGEGVPFSRPQGNRLPSDYVVMPAAGAASSPELGGKEPPPGVGMADGNSGLAGELAGASGRPVQADEHARLEELPSLGGLVLPPNFSTAHFLDPRFIAGIANELFAEGRPQLPGPEGFAAMMPEGLADAVPGMPFGDSLPAMPAAAPRLPLPEAGAMPTPGSAPRRLPARPEGMPTPPSGPAPIDYQDPRIFLGIAQEFLAPVPAGVPEGTTLASKGAEESFYFLTPPQPAAAPSPRSAQAPLSSRSFHVEEIRRDFPVLHQTVHGKPLIWLDNAATTQKPRRVIEALARFYERDNSNIHRGAHTLAARATNLYEEARDKVRRFLGAGEVEEIVFVRGATEAINLVAQSYGRKYIGKGDEIVLSTLEHHSNIVPWHHLVQEKGAVLRVVPVNDRGEVLLDEYEKLLGPRTKFVALTHVSNALGTVLPVRTMTQLAHRHGARVLIDGAQSVPHLPVDVQALDCDFYAFSGHKLFAPTGIGVLYGKRDVLESMPPWQGGGNMIDQVTFESVTYQRAPARFEAGTGNLAGAVGLGAAIDYLDELGMENINRYEHELLAHGTQLLGAIPGVRLIGTAADKASVLSFVLEGVRTEDLGRYLDQEGIAVRAGHHCAQPALRRFGLSSTVRPSLAFYNTPEELDALAAAVRKAANQFSS